MRLTMWRWPGVALVCNPALSGCEPRLSRRGRRPRGTPSPCAPAGDLQAPQTPTLSIVATDTSGNTTSTGRVLQIADTVKPTVTALTTGERLDAGRRRLTPRCCEPT